MSCDTLNSEILKFRMKHNLIINSKQKSQI